LGPVFGRLRDALDAERLTMTDEPEAAPPEAVLVLEVAGEIDDFLGAVRRIGGLEYLADELGDKMDDTDLFAEVDQKGRRKPMKRELFVVASDRRAADELDSLWSQWQRDKTLPRPWGKWREAFERLDVLRHWNDEDRLNRTGALQAWREELRDRDPSDKVPLEIELWYRAVETRRQAEEDAVEASLERAGGRLLSSFQMADISYHGVLAELPAAVLLEMADRIEANWLSGNGVRFLRAVGQARMPVFERPEYREVDTPDGEPQGSPRVALLDGVPVAGHRLLDGRIVLDDPDNWQETSEVKHRQHGTAMASTIVHGDLAKREAPLQEPIYVRPIIRVEDGDGWVDRAEETVPRDRLAVELVHDAVVRMLEGENAQAPGVKIINLSVGDHAQPFNRFVSPWARLLDHLSFRYEVLFVVSAGNHGTELVFPDDVDLDNPAELESEALVQVARRAGVRRLLAPAESANALTVGAANSDGGEVPDDERRVPIATPGLMAPLSAWGPGHNRAVKPEVLAAGGRQAFDSLPGGGEGERHMAPTETPKPPGIAVATPGIGGDLTKASWICGTSPATALVSRSGARVLARLDELREEWENEEDAPTMPDRSFDAVLVKAALVHGACWNGAGDALEVALRDANLPAGKADRMRAIGYGEIRDGWPLVDDDHRITAIYADRISEGEHIYRLPLPQSLAGKPLWRRLTLTLAWLTPVNVAHRGYRRAALSVDPRGSLDFARDRQEADGIACKKGTVQHEILDSSRAAAYVDGTELEFVITCREAAGALEEQVPYAFLATLETEKELGIPVYDEVRPRLRQPVARVRPSAAS
jgi:Subtilase family